MPTPKKATSPAGSYLVQQHLKEARGSPLPPAPSSLGAENASLRQELQRLQQLHAALKRRMANGNSNGMAGLMAKEVLDHGADGTVLVTAVSNAGHQAGGAVAVQHADAGLSPQEVEEAAARCHWIAHYWEVAAQLGIYAEVATDRAEYWRSLAPSEQAFHSIVQRTVASALPTPSTASTAETPSAAAALSAVSVPAMKASSAAGAANAAPSPSPGAGAEQLQVQVSAADLVEMERGMRQVVELGVVQEVRCSLLWAAEMRGRQQAAQFVDGPAAALGGAGVAPSLSLQDLDLEDPSLPFEDLAASTSPVDEPDGTPHGTSLSKLECQEMRFQASWLAYLWSRALLAGVEPHIALLRAEHWAGFLERPRCHVRHWSELAAAQQELQLLGVEQQLWQCRAW